MAPRLGDNLVAELLAADQGSEAGIAAQRARVQALRDTLRGAKDAEAVRLESLADYLVKKSVWLVAADGWAYDIGYGGPTTCSRDVATSTCWSWTPRCTPTPGGSSRSRRRSGASAKFAASGKAVGKKDLSLLATMYGHVYVARVAFGPRWPRPRRPSWRPRPTPARR
jgi:pyruvate-ferredoxin/flavodoxin oxidoreductase